MDWQSAQTKIQSALRPNTDLNTSKSTYRRIIAANVPIQSSRYGYENEKGYIVSIGETAKISIPWSMLEKCFAQLDNPNGYDGKYFRRDYRKQAADHGCHVHVVGQIFVASGIAYLDGDRYRLLKS
jgi:hypothetical protein